MPLRGVQSEDWSVAQRAWCGHVCRVHWSLALPSWRLLMLQCSCGLGKSDRCPNTKIGGMVIAEQRDFGCRQMTGGSDQIT